MVALAENIKYEEQKENQRREKFAEIAEMDIGDVAVDFRYEAFGIMIDKCDAFRKGVYPVFYGLKEELQQMLPKEEYWRIVSMNLNDSKALIDWSHEREWRCKGDFHFEYNEIYIIVGCQKSKEEFIEYYDKVDKGGLEQIKGIIVLEDYLEESDYYKSLQLSKEEA